MHILSHLRVLPVLAIAVLAAMVSAQQDPVRVRLSDQLFPLAERGEEAEQQVLRVVDGVTGQPLAGAEVFVIGEASYPLSGVFTFEHRTVADADGFARIQKKGYWLMARAPGHGPGMDMGRYDRVFPLARAIDVPVLVRDWRGQAMAGYVVGWCCGCGHTPDLSNAVTDGHGLAWLRGIDPGNGISDLYLENAPIKFDYDSVEWSPGDPPDLHSFGPGAVLRGQVLLPDGSPAKGAMVGSNEKHRGPWAQTGDDGRFVAGGMQSGEVFVVGHGDRKIEFPWPMANPCTLRLPPPNGETWDDSEPRALGPQGVLHCRVAIGDTELRGAALAARGPLPGNWVHRTDEGRLELVAGRYQLQVWHEDMFDFTREIEVAADTVTELSIAATALPTVRLRCESLPADMGISLRSSHGKRDVTDLVRDGTPIPIDPGADYGVTLELGYDSRTFPVTGMAMLHASLPPFRWYAATRITGRLVDQAGRPIAADVALLQPMTPHDVDGDRVVAFDPRTASTTASVDGVLALATDHERGVYLWIQPRDPSLRPRFVNVPLPLRGDDVRVDLGTIELPAKPRLRLRTANGQPLRAAAALLRTGTSDFRDHRHPVFALAPDGSWIGPDLQVGDGILVPAAEEPIADHAGALTATLPFRIAIDGDMPLDLQLPNGRIELLVHDDAGQRLPDITVLLREGMWHCQGQLAIAQVPAGEHRVFVSCEGRRSAIVDLTLAAGQRREVRVVLPAR